MQYLKNQIQSYDRLCEVFAVETGSIMLINNMLLRPYLEYCVQLCSPMTKKHECKHTQLQWKIANIAGRM